MKKLILSAFLLFCFSNIALAQKKILGAETYSIKLPSGFERTVGTNDAASVQWENEIKEVYGYVLFENIDELTIADITTESKNYADLSLNNFNDDDTYKLINTRKYKTKSGLETEERELSYFDKEIEIEIHFLINIFKSKHFIYKMINYGSSETFKNARTDIQYIIDHVKLPK